MINLSILVVFIPTFVFVSLTPGMCMTLSMTMGMSIGLRRTLWMMWGELLGVGLVAVLSVLGVATIMLEYPSVFVFFKIVGGAYLIYLGVQMWRSRGKMAICNTHNSFDVSRLVLATQGFMTAVANPKGWAFFIALLPPFILKDQPLVGQLSVLISIMLLIEFCSLLIYATGGSTLRKFLQKSDNVKMINRIAGTLMIGVGFWLAFD